MNLKIIRCGPNTVLRGKFVQVMLQFEKCDFEKNAFKVLSDIIFYL